MTRYARRLQQIGSRILVSLPSEWIKNNKLEKGNIVPVDVNRDNTLSIFPSESEAEHTKEATIQYSPASMDSLVNQVYGAYLLAVPILVTLTDRFDPRRIYLVGVGFTVIGHLYFGFAADGYARATGSLAGAEVFPPGGRCRLSRRPRPRRRSPARTRPPRPRPCR